MYIRNHANSCEGANVKCEYVNENRNDERNQ